MKSDAPAPLLFVVQQHDATNMHWDFRLEMDGVLVSWAIPKGPSIDPGIKRLAMKVEDHGYDYKDFEGIINKGQYGAGKVIIWDEGTYEPVNPNKESMDNMHTTWLHSGRLEFHLNGQKLRGLWTLFKASGTRFGPNAWLLAKKKDEYATGGEIVNKLRQSVRSGKTVNEMSEEEGCIDG